MLFLHFYYNDDVFIVRSKKKKKKKKKDSSLKTAKFKDPLPGFQRHENFLFAESHEDPEKSLDFSKPRDLSSMCRSQEEDLFP